MSLSLVERIANAVLYEGYMLYPYRPSAVKNQQRWNFGALCPETYSVAQGGTEAWTMQTECLVLGDQRTKLDVKLRCLHLLARAIGELLHPLAALAPATEPEFTLVQTLEVGGRLYQTWQEAVEREVCVPTLDIATLLARPQQVAFAFPASRTLEALRTEGGPVVGVIVRTQQALAGVVELRLSACGAAPVAVDNDATDPAAAASSAAQTAAAQHVYKLSARILNTTPPAAAAEQNRDDALLRSLVSTHTILTVQGGEFVSLLDPPAALRPCAGQCQNVGTWPVLVGAEGARDCLLSSPIILYDYPQIAPESAGDLFDGTEIDEILTLRIMTLTEQEKREMRDVDDRARQMLERTDTLPVEQLMKMHGAMRSLRPKPKDEEPAPNS